MYRVWFVRISTHLQIGMGKIWNLVVMDEVCIYIKKNLPPPLFWVAEIIRHALSVWDAPASRSPICDFSMRWFDRCRHSMRRWFDRSSFSHLEIGMGEDFLPGSDGRSLHLKTIFLLPCLGGEESWASPFYLCVWNAPASRSSLDLWFFDEVVRSLPAFYAMVVRSQHFLTFKSADFQTRQ